LRPRESFNIYVPIKDKLGKNTLSGKVTVENNIEKSSEQFILKEQDTRKLYTKINRESKEEEIKDR
jgi:hypothetical protein